MICLLVFLIWVIEKSAAAEAREKDMNTRPRSEVPFVGTVVSVINEELASQTEISNVYAKALLGYLKSNDEQLIASAASILLAVIQVR